EAVAESPERAAQVVNALARAAEVDSRERADQERQDTIRKTGERHGRETDIRNRLLADARDERLRARELFGVESLELEVKKLREDILSHEARIRDLDRRRSTNRLRLERVQSDRSVVEHLQREGAPRIVTASAEARVAESDRVKTVSARLESLHRDLLALLRRYTNEHPEVRSLRHQVRETEVELTRARAMALGQDIDREELQLRTDNELAAIEQRVVEPELGVLRQRASDVSPYLERVERHEEQASDANRRIVQLEGIRAQLEGTPLTGGYLSLEERALPGEAARVEMKLRRSWPVALLASFVVGVSIAFLLDLTDTSLRTDLDVRRHLEWSTLGLIPRVPRSEVLALAPGRPNVIAERYDTLATLLLNLPGQQGTSRLFVMTGANPQEGKTSAAINLAAALARQGRRTLLVDGDLRVPAIHVDLALPNETGFSDVLAGRALLLSPGLVQDTEIPTLKVLPSGISPDNPYELLDPARLGPVTAHMKEQFEAVVLDSPPVLLAGDALKMSGIADAVVFVVEAGRTDTRQAAWAKRLLQSVNAPVAGVLLNRALGESVAYYPMDVPMRGEQRRMSMRS
ncbi:MAG TPA: polysaccharide biosynthesis tyrosine autokinase, partial [Planctomycetota bacterium]|nr:polysaccharide biosynthesis tyrosine autokinase [Planctomycetota bacterium]